jgi:adenylate cyclase
MESNDIAEAERLARRAVQLGKEDPVALSRAGYGLAYVVGDLDTGAALIDRALSMTPNLSDAWRFSAWVRVWLGEPDVAIDHFARAMRLNPRDPLFYSLESGAAFAHFFAGRYEEASSWAARALRNQTSGLRHQSLRMAAASNALAGRLEEAQRAMELLRRHDPALRISDLRKLTPLRRQQDVDRYEEALRLAGLPS